MNAAASQAGVGRQDYLAFLNTLLGAGSRLPQATPLILDGMTDMTNGISKWEQAASIIAGNSPAVEAARLRALPRLGSPFTVEKIAIEKEQQILKLLKDHHDHPSLPAETNDRLKAIGDGQIINMIRGLWSFLQANPQLLQFFLQLFAQITTNPTPAPQV